MDDRNTCTKKYLMFFKGFIYFLEQVNINDIYLVTILIITHWRLHVNESSQ